MEIEAFNMLAGGMSMAEVLRNAPPAYPPRKSVKPTEHLPQTNWTMHP